MIDTALSGLNNLALSSKIRNDDGVDQLHHFFTVTILAAFAALTGFVEFAGEPINCWNYGDYLWGHFQDHVNKFCWTHNLYHYPNLTHRSTMPYLLDSLGNPEQLDVYTRGEELGQITFFRWVTIIFLIQAFLFKVPNLVWSEYNTYMGSNIVKMVEMLQDILFARKEEKQEKLAQVALFLEQWLWIHRKPHWFMRSKVSTMMKKTLSCCTLCIGDNISNTLSNMYLVTKLLFLINNIMQFLLLSAFLQMNFWHFGVHTLQAYTDDEGGRAQNQGETFPTVALCHFQVYDKGPSTKGVASATGKWVQCILTINVWLEKLFLIEWFWLLLLLVITIASFAHWCFKILQTQTAIKFVAHYMKLQGVYGEAVPVPKSCSQELFVTEYLRNDGVFVLRILAVNTNEVVLAQLVEELWKRYVHLGNSGDDVDQPMAETAFVNPEEKPNVPEPARV